MNQTNSNLLRRTLEALDMTSAALARQLSEMRDDGKETGPGTVSRWLNGVSATDPGVMCWLRELLRNRLRNEGIGRIDWGLTESVLLVVGNAKGGVGSSSLAAGLAVVAEEEFGQRVRHIRLGVHDDGEAKMFRKVLNPRKITSEAVSFKEVEKCIPRNKEFVIVDVSRATMSPAQLAQAVSRLPYNLLLIPADFGSSMEADASKGFFDHLRDQESVAFLHHPGFKIWMDFARFVRSPEFTLWESQFISFIFSRAKTDLFDWTTGEWSLFDQKLLCADLFIELLQRVGLDYKSAPTLESDIEALSLEQLLEAAGH